MPKKVSWDRPKVEALVLDMFFNFHLVKNHKIALYSATAEAREKIRTNFKSVEFQIFNVCLTIFTNNQILHNKISHWYLVTNKLFTGWHMPIRSKQRNNGKSV